MANQALPEGVAQGTKGLVVGQAGWIQRRWRVRFDDGPDRRRAGVRARAVSWAAVASTRRVSFRRDRLTWLAYALLAWFAYLQAAPGLVVPYLRDELDIGYTTGGLHVAAFATGSMLAGLTATRIEARGRSSRAAVGLGGRDGARVSPGSRAGPVAAATVGALLVAGFGGGLLLVTVQALLADHHGPQRAIALTEANVFASAAYVVLVGAVALFSWRVALAGELPRPARALPHLAHGRRSPRPRTRPSSTAGSAARSTSPRR